MVAGKIFINLYAMKQLLHEYAAYNVWANRQITNVLAQFATEKLTMQNGSSFGSIYGTLVHLMETERSWWQRIHLQERIVLPERDMQEEVLPVVKLLLESSAEWLTWIQQAKERQLEHVFGYHNSKKEYFKQPVYQVLLHVFNHQTFHRGQIITMLRQQGADKLPNTDFITFSRKK